MIKSYTHKCQGTCSRSIEISYDSDTKIIESVKFNGGCPGNTLGVSALVKGRTLDEVYKLVSGIKCGSKSTSCPNELAIGIKEIESSEN